MATSIDVLMAVKTKVMAMHDSEIADKSMMDRTLAGARAGALEDVMLVLDQALTAERAAGV